MPKLRVDQLLVDRGLAESRAKAQALVMAGLVFSGEPLDFNSVVEKVFVEGILAYEREKDARIQRLLQSAPAGKQED